MRTNNFKKASLIVFLLLLPFFTGCCIIHIDGSKGKYQRTEQLNTPLAPNSRLIANTDIGNITVLGKDITDCNVTAQICVKAPTEQEAQEIADKIKIQLKQSGSTLTIKIERPHKKRNRKISIDLNITIPTQTSLVLETDVGKINIENVAGQINAETDVGTITCENISNDIELRTDVGAIKVIYSKNAPSVINADLSTDVGNINFTAPANLSATVHASVDVGSISTNLPLTVTGMIGKTLNGTLGAGKGALNFRTDVGSIKIK